jgi:hypothetical protein
MRYRWCNGFDCQRRRAESAKTGGVQLHLLEPCRKLDGSASAAQTSMRQMMPRDSSALMELLLIHAAPVLDIPYSRLGFYVDQRGSNPHNQDAEDLYQGDHG